MTGFSELRAALELAVEALNNVEIMLGIQPKPNGKPNKPRLRGKCPTCGQPYSINSAGKRYCQHCLSERMRKYHTTRGGEDIG